MTLATFLVLGCVLVIPATIAVCWRRFRAANTANARAGMLTATEWLQDETQRTMRAQLWDMQKLGTNVPSNDVYVATADKVGRVCQTIGYYVKRGFVPLDMVIDNWGREMVSTWDACKPWAEYRREDEEDPSVWADFEWLANESLARYPGPAGAANA
jgi:hypothetical protein